MAKKSTSTVAAASAALAAETTEVALTAALIEAMNVTEMRKAAAARGVKGASRMNRAALVPALTAFIPAPKPAPAVKKQNAAAATPAKTDTAPVPAVDKAQAKADRFMKGVVESGWQATSAVTTPENVSVTATRGGETILISWAGPVFIYGEATYAAAPDARPVKIRNASQARQIAAAPAKARAKAATK